MRLRLLIINIFLFSTLFSSNFQNGNQEYTKGNLSEAENHYLKDMEERGESFNTLYNLGSLSISLNKEGYSKYYLTKAQGINPRDRDLNKIIKSVGIKRKLLNKNETMIINSTLFLIFTITLVIYILLKNLSKFKNLKIIKNISVLFLTLAIVFTILTSLEILKGKEGIILNETMVYLSPYEESEESFNINTGEQVTINDSFSNYYYLKDNKGRYGWINKENVGELWIQ